MQSSHVPPEPVNTWLSVLVVVLVYVLIFWPVLRSLYEGASEIVEFRRQGLTWGRAWRLARKR